MKNEVSTVIMLLRSSRTVLSLVAFLITACSSGGDQADIEAPLPPAASGDQVVLNRTNALAFMSALYRTVEPIYHLSSALDPLATDADSDPLLFSYIGFPRGGVREEACESGALITEESKGKDGSGTLRLSFNDCQIEGEQITGSVTYFGLGSGNPINIVLEDLTLRTDWDTVTYQGRATHWAARYLEAKDVRVKSQALQQEARLTDFRMDYYSFSGTLALNDIGWVAFSYDESLKQVVLEGASGSVLTGTHDHVYIQLTPGIFEPLITAYAFELSAPEGGVTATFQSSTQIHQILLWPYLNNTQPQLSGNGGFSTFRAEPLHLTSTSWVDAEGDFVSVNWGVAESPPNCAAQLSESAAGTYFTAPCRGAYKLSARVNDGNTSQVEALVDVIVLPQPAKLEVPPQMDIGSGSLDVKLAASNEVLDGPFSYELAYAPAGVNLDADGRLTGRPQAFNVAAQHVFRIGVQQSGHPETLKELTVSLLGTASAKTWLPSTQTCLTDNILWNDINGNGLPELACLYGGSYFILEKDGPGVSFSYAHSRVEDGGLISVGQADLTGDGVDEVLLRSRDWLSILDGPSKAVIRRVSLKSAEFSLEDPRLDVRFASSWGIGLGRNGAYGDFYIYDYHTDSFWTSRNHGSHFAIINETASGDPLALTWGGSLYDYSDGSETYLGGGFLRFSDFDSDGKKEILSFDRSTENYKAYFNIYRTDPLTKERQVATKIETSASNAYRFNGTPWFTKFNSDSTQLLFVDGKTLHVFDYVSPTYTYRGEYTLPAGCGYQVAYADQNETFLQFYGFSNVCYYSLANKAFESIQLPPFTVPPLYGDVRYHPVDKNALLWFSPSENLAGNGRTHMAYEVDRDGTVSGGGTVYDTGFVGSPSGLAPIFDDQGGLQKTLLADRGEIKIFEAATGDLLDTLTGDADFFSLLTLDLDHDGETDLLSDGHSWIDLASGSALSTVKSPIFISGLPHDSSPTFFVLDVSGDGRRELVHLQSDSQNESVIAVYKVANKQLSLWTSVQVDNEKVVAPYKTTLRPMSFAGQDIDGDGIPEILLSYSDCIRGSSHSIVAVFKPMTGSLTEVTTSECLDTLMTVASIAPKSNILASARQKRPGYSSDPTGAETSYFLEISPFTGHTTWKSELFPGVVTFNHLFVFGDDSYLSRKAAVLSSGLVLFD